MVRLPKVVAFPDDVHRVDILKIGRSRVIVPQGKRWEDLFSGPRRVRISWSSVERSSENEAH
jgi:antitoxin VapB